MENIATNELGEEISTFSKFSPNFFVAKPIKNHPKSTKSKKKFFVIFPFFFEIFLVSLLSTVGAGFKGATSTGLVIPDSNGFPEGSKSFLVMETAFSRGLGNSLSSTSTWFNVVLEFIFKLVESVFSGLRLTY